MESLHGSRLHSQNLCSALQGGCEARTGLPILQEPVEVNLAGLSVRRRHAQSFHFHLNGAVTQVRVTVSARWDCGVADGPLGTHRAACS